MRKSILALAGIAAITAMPALADNTDNATVNVSGTIVAPLEITQASANLTMPHLVRPASGEGNTSVALTCHQSTDASNTVAYSGNGNPFANGTAAASAVSGSSANATAVGSPGTTGACAALTVTGEASYNFIVAFGAPTSSTTGITISSPQCTDDAGTAVPNNTSLNLGAGASKGLRCGATVAAADTNVAATYAGSYTVTVTYD